MRLRFSDQARVASAGVRARKLRATLSALGIAIGVAAIVAVLGLSSSSQAGLLAEIDRLGTNLLTASSGQSFGGSDAQLPLEAPARVGNLAAVESVAHTGDIAGANVYRTPLIPAVSTNAIQVRAASLNLLSVVATGMAKGRWLNEATATQPVAVLGATAAKRLGFDRVTPGQRVWLGGQWFYVAGILAPAKLASALDTSVLVGYPAAHRYLDHVAIAQGRAVDGPPSKLYVRAATDQVTQVQAVLAQTANPESPNEVDISQPSDALTARAAAEGAFDSLFLGLGVVALIVGAVGVANIMIISVLERRSEIGLRRALGATRRQIRGQFLAEAVLLTVLGGTAGVAAGMIATVVYARNKGWQVVVPVEAWAGGIAAAVLIGAIAGLVPALRAARLSPTEALRTI
ncbi:ABC transporter permease [Paractinoplanes durhamensis]|uniref:ABC transporter permease n=1 Tax=Paractinoplanes durhamensis TaxID=113563 RepID=A0ABQ3Z850_9ACTN|nr:ABC transporter permease [Actinoplanes durhamensis]GIE05995.1 ABC transporter permease [Actinoplanes durhamensis]